MGVAENLRLIAEKLEGVADFSRRDADYQGMIAEFSRAHVDTKFNRVQLILHSIPDRGH